MVKVSIVIPNFNGREVLAKNLPAVIDAAREYDRQTEVIVVDDASTDDSVSYLKKEFPKVVLYCHRKNQYFAAACNTGVAHARGEIIVLLNNDCLPDKNFLKFLISHFNEDDVFAVGCQEIDSKNGVPVICGRGVMKYRRGLVVHWRASEQTEGETSWVTAGSGAYSREKWRILGGLDVLFRPAYEEDRDLSYRASKHGWKNLYEPKSVVVHHHETTNRRVFGERKIKMISLKNQFLFVWKNITDRSFLALHIFWLPYHLTVTNFRTKGLLGVGLLMALKQLPEVLQSRKKAKSLFVKKDRELI